MDKDSVIILRCESMVKIKAKIVAEYHNLTLSDYLREMILTDYKSLVRYGGMEPE